MPNPNDDFDSNISKLDKGSEKLSQINSLSQGSNPLLHEVFELLIADRFPYLSNPQHETESRLRQTQEFIASLMQEENREADIIRDIEEIHKKEIEEWIEQCTADDEEKMKAQAYLEKCMLILLSENDKFIALIRSVQLINQLKLEIAAIYTLMGNKIFDLFDRVINTIPKHKFTIPGTNVEVALPDIMKELGNNLGNKIKQGIVTAENIATVFKQEFYDQAKSLANVHGLTKEKATAVEQKFNEWYAMQPVQNILAQAQNIINLHQPELNQKQQQLAAAANRINAPFKELSQQIENPNPIPNGVNERPSRDIKVVSLNSLSSSQQQSEKQNNKAEENEPGSNEANADDGLSDEERELQELASLGTKKLSP